MIDFSKPGTFVLFTFILLIFGVIRIAFDLDINTFGVNKTVGWAWDLTNLTVAAPVLIILFSLLGYSTMWLCKLKINKTIALFNLSFLTGALGLIGSNFSAIFGLNAFLMLVISISYGIAAKKYEKKKKSE